MRTFVLTQNVGAARFFAHSFCVGSLHTKPARQGVKPVGAGQLFAENLPQIGVIVRFSGCVARFRFVTFFVGVAAARHCAASYYLRFSYFGSEDPGSDLGGGTGPM